VRLTLSSRKRRTLRRSRPSTPAGRDRALADWARKVVKSPTATTAADIDRLRQAGFSDREIFEATVLMAFRVAFSMVNNALGVNPDPQLADEAPPEVREVVTYGRKPAAYAG
jgi:alkylhydroperoxidase family enzyme